MKTTDSWQSPAECTDSKSVIGFGTCRIETQSCEIPFTTLKLRKQLKRKNPTRGETMNRLRRLCGSVLLIFLLSPTFHSPPIPNPKFQYKNRTKLSERPDRDRSQQRRDLRCTQNAGRTTPSPSGSVITDRDASKTTRHVRRSGRPGLIPL